jgi:hypothetical protein
MTPTIHRCRVLEDGALTPEARQFVTVPGIVSKTLLQGDDGSTAYLWTQKGVVLIEDTSAVWAESAVKMFLANGALKAV